MLGHILETETVKGVKIQYYGRRPWFPASINRHTGKPHKNEREIARHKKRGY